MHSPINGRRRRVAAGRQAVRLADGAHVIVRPIGEEDAEGFAHAFTRLSDESRRRRFLSATPRLSARTLTYLTAVDHDQHVALVAVEPKSGEILGSVRYVRTIVNNHYHSKTRPNDPHSDPQHRPLHRRVGRCARFARVQHRHSAPQPPPGLRCTPELAATINSSRARSTNPSPYAHRVRTTARLQIDLPAGIRQQHCRAGPARRPVILAPGD
jgi:hypothetical protein